jgi:hypothetical protein
MVFPIVSAALVVTLAASSNTVELSRAQVAAAEYGTVLGAAAQCHQIDQERVGAATHRASVAVHNMVLTDDQFERARVGFESAAQAGGAKIMNHEESCADADSALKRLEEELGH